jgi:hypothetical protein
LVIAVAHVLFGQGSGNIARGTVTHGDGLMLGVICQGSKNLGNFLQLVWEEAIQVKVKVRNGRLLR